MPHKTWPWKKQAMVDIFQNVYASVPRKWLPVMERHQVGEWRKGLQYGG